MKRPAVFFRAHSKFTLGRGQWRNQVMPLLVKSFRTYNQKKNKRLTCFGVDLKYMGAQEVGQFKSFNDFWILAIYSNY